MSLHMYRIKSRRRLLALAICRWARVSKMEHFGTKTEGVKMGRLSVRNLYPQKRNGRAVFATSLVLKVTTFRDKASYKNVQPPENFPCANSCPRGKPASVSDKIWKLCIICRRVGLCPALFHSIPPSRKSPYYVTQNTQIVPNWSVLTLRQQRASQCGRL